MFICRSEAGSLLRCIAAWGFIAAGYLLALNADAQDTPIAARRPWTSSRVHGSPVPPAPYAIVPAFPQLKFELPTSLEVIPGGKQMLVTERAAEY